MYTASRSSCFPASLCLEFAELSPRPRFPASPHSHGQGSELDAGRREAEKTGVLSVFVFLHDQRCSCLPSFPESNQNAFLRVTWTNSVFSGHLSPLNEYRAREETSFLQKNVHELTRISSPDPAQARQCPGGCETAPSPV